MTNERDETLSRILDNRETLLEIVRELRQDNDYLMTDPDATAAAIEAARMHRLSIAARFAKLVVEIDSATLRSLPKEAEESSSAKVATIPFMPTEIEERAS